MSTETEVEVEVEEERKGSQLFDYLQAPRKKRRDYVVMALGKNFDPDVSSDIELYIRQAFPELALTQPRSSRELVRLFNRQIVLLIMDDQFDNLTTCMEMVKNLKVKKSGTLIPVLFLTQNSKDLIEHYHKHLLVYQESDNYLQFRSMDLPQVYARIHSALNLKNARRSRRFKVDIPVQYLHFSKGQNFPGQLIDISVHGAVLLSKDHEIFRPNDQLQLHIPTQKLLPPECGEFMRLSAKVRRVFMGGDKVGISWEYMSESQNLLLTQFILELINKQILRMRMKNKVHPRS